MDNHEEKDEAVVEETPVENNAETAAEETHAEVEAVEENEQRTDNSDPLRVSRKGVKLFAEPEIDPDKQPSFTCLYISIALFALGVVSLALAIGLAFVVPNAGIYFLVGAMIAELAAISFCNAQKMKGKHKLTVIFKVLSYVVLFAAVLIFAIGTGISATNK